MAARRFAFVTMIGAALAGCVSGTPVAPPPPAAPRYIETGLASYYGPNLAQNRTAAGGRVDPSAMTAAHRSLPFGTQVRVTNLANGRAVIVEITDRGPFTRGRIIDVSESAAAALGMKQGGLASVRLEVIDPAIVPAAAPR